MSERPEEDASSESGKPEGASSGEERTSEDGFAQFGDSTASPVVPSYDDPDPSPTSPPSETPQSEALPPAGPYSSPSAEPSSYEGSFGAAGPGPMPPEYVPPLPPEPSPHEPSWSPPDAGAYGQNLPPMSTMPAREGRALTSMILGLVALCGLGPLACCSPLLSGLVQLVAGGAATAMGIKSRSDIARSGGQLTGEGFAIAGIIIGAVAALAGFLSLIIGFNSLGD